MKNHSGCWFKSQFQIFWSFKKVAVDGSVSCSSVPFPEKIPMVDAEKASDFPWNPWCFGTSIFHLYIQLEFHHPDDLSHFSEFFFSKPPTSMPGAFHSHGGAQGHGWFIIQNRNLKWMITGGPLPFQERYQEFNPMIFQPMIFQPHIKPLFSNIDGRYELPISSGDRGAAAPLLCDLGRGGGAGCAAQPRGGCWVISMGKPWENGWEKRWENGWISPGTTRRSMAKVHRIGWFWRLGKSGRSEKRYELIWRMGTS